eukprot:5952132-Amphidinium_carterae.1
MAAGCRGGSLSRVKDAMYDDDDEDMYDADADDDYSDDDDDDDDLGNNKTEKTWVDTDLTSAFRFYMSMCTVAADGDDDDAGKSLQERMCNIAQAVQREGRARTLRDSER